MYSYIMIHFHSCLKTLLLGVVLFGPQQRYERLIKIKGDSDDNLHKSNLTAQL